MIATVNGLRCQSLTLRLSQSGPWYADAVLDEAPAVSLTDIVAVEIGGAAWRGRVAPDFSGEFGVSRKLRVVGGLGWISHVRARSYLNDLGVKVRTVAEDLARDVGEQIGTFTLPIQRMGSHYIRLAGAAAQTLEQVLDGTPWWVDAEGLTHAGPRVTHDAVPGSYEILSYDPMTREVVMSVTDPLAIDVGSRISDPARLDVPLVVREYELRATAESFRLVAWVGGSPTSDCRIPRAMRAIVRRLTSDKLWGVYRYVVATPGERLTLRSSETRTDGLPDSLPSVVQVVGAPGITGDWQEGQGVIVAFLSGDPDQPRVIGYEMGGVPSTLSFVSLNSAELTGKSVTVASETTLDLTAETKVAIESAIAEIKADLIQLGGAGGLPVARIGDPIQAGPYAGVITGGSTKVTAT